MVLGSGPVVQAERDVAQKIMPQGTWIIAKPMQTVLQWLGAKYPQNLRRRRELVKPGKSASIQDDPNIFQRGVQVRASRVNGPEPLFPMHASVIAGTHPAPKVASILFGQQSSLLLLDLRSLILGRNHQYVTSQVYDKGVGCTTDNSSVMAIKGLEVNHLDAVGMVPPSRAA
jgi:hypothetical protein